jgi:hypothetical protein
MAKAKLAGKWRISKEKRNQWRKSVINNESGGAESGMVYYHRENEGNRTKNNGEKIIMLS